MSLDHEMDAASMRALDDYRTRIDPLADQIAYRTAFFAGAKWAAEHLGETQRAEVSGAVTRSKGR